MSASCRLCGSEAAPVGRALLLGREVAYYLCPRCELLQTESPVWLAEAYADAISHLDTGAVARNRLTAQLTAVVARVVGARGPCLDYGAGHGVFVRMMRDLGLDFRWYDTYAQNLYAGGFEGSPGEHYAIVTAFELLEHLADVRGDVEAIFAGQPDHVLVGTLLHHGWDPSWWYLLPETGQHVAFYAPATLRTIAELVGYDVIIGPEYSLFSRRAPGAVKRAVLQRLLARPSLAGIVPGRLVARGSLVQPDHEAMRRRKHEP